MAQNDHAGRRNDDTELKFYLAAGGTPSSESGWIGRVWAALFAHGVDPSE